MKAAAISRTKRKPSRTLIAKAGRTSVAAIVLLRVIARMAEIAADAVDVLVAADEIVDAAGAVDVRVAADGIADAAGQVGEGTKNLLPRIHTDIKKGHGESRGLFSCRSKLPLESKEPKSRCEI